MTRSYAYSSLAFALALALGGCSTWQNMDRSEKGTAVGATGGAIVGAAVGGPVGAAVGAGVGGYAGHYETQPGGLAANDAGARYGRTAGSGMRYGQNSAEIRSVQQALNDQGYDAGAVDGQMGPTTQDALRRFQQAKNLPQTGEPDARTLAALGVSNQAASQEPNRVNESNPSYRANESRQSSASSRYETQPRRMASSASTGDGNNQGADTIRSVQQALSDQGYDTGTVDGVMGPHTQHALRQFQQAHNLRRTGRLDEPTLAALGVSNEPPDEAANPSTDTEASNRESTAANHASDRTENPSNPPSAVANSSTASSLPGAPANPDSNASNRSDEADPTTAGSNPASKQPQ